MKTANIENNKISLADFISQNYGISRTDGEDVIVIFDDGKDLSITNRESKRRITKDYFQTTGEWPYRCSCKVFPFGCTDLPGPY